MKWDCPELKNKKKNDENEGSSRPANIVEDDSDAANGDLLSIARTSGPISISSGLSCKCIPLNFEFKL
jgi:hypothetical protein